MPEKAQQPQTPEGVPEASDSSDSSSEVHGETIPLLFLMC